MLGEREKMPESDYILYLISNVCSVSPMCTSLTWRIERRRKKGKKKEEENDVTLIQISGMDKKEIDKYSFLYMIKLSLIIVAINFSNFLSDILWIRNIRTFTAFRTHYAFYSQKTNRNKEQNKTLHGGV